MRSSLLALPTALLAVAVAAAPASQAGDFPRLVNGITGLGKAVHRKPPPVAKDPAMDRTIDELDWLERFVDRYGSIVAKQPDVWGQNRLTRHREEYEDQLRARLDSFEVVSTAAIRRSDQAFLGMAMALQAAADRRPGPAAVPLPPVAETPPSPPGPPFADLDLALEPTVQLDQLSRYVNHLHELRRINEGDDIADSPGYSLTLVRIPVSITPGKVTQAGHGAKITVSARLVLGPELLPVTYRSLVINDLVDTIAPALTWAVNDADCVRWAAMIVEPLRARAAAVAGDERGVLPRGEMLLEDDGRMEAVVRSLAARLPSISPSTAPSVKSRRARMPIPFSQLADAAGTREIAILIHDAHTALANHPATRPCIEYGEVRNYLAEELEAAYDFLAQESQRPIWMELPQWNLAEAVRSRRVAEVGRSRAAYESLVGEAWPTTTAVLGWAILLESVLLNERLADDIRDSALAQGCPEGIASRGPFYGPDPAPEARQAFNDYVCRRWPIRVFALDPVAQDQNVEDVFARRRELQIAAAMAFASGRMGSQALMRFTRRLETDMATIALNRTAAGFAHGPDTFGWIFQPRVQTPPTRSTLAAFTETVCGPCPEADLMQRRLEPGMRECAAIIVMPSFVPRVVFDVETQWFSLAHPADVKPSMREAMLYSRSVKAIEAGVLHCQCHAHRYRANEIDRVLQKVARLDRRLPTQTMEAPIPYENTSGGFELFSSGITDLAPELIGWYGAPGIDPDGTTSLYLIGKGFSVHDTSVIAGGRRVKVSLISREVLVAEIPPGVQALPEKPQGCAVGVAAAPVVRPVALAAEELPAPAEAAAEGLGCGEPCHGACNDRAVVNIHLATPYGVSSHLFVPVVRGRGQAEGAAALAFAEAYRIGLSFSTTKPVAGNVPTAKVDEFYSLASDEIVIRVPRYFIPPAKAELSCTLIDEATGGVAGTFGASGLPFDARRGVYRIAGNDLRNFIGDTSRPATDKTLRGAVKPYLDALLAQGRLGEAGESVTFRLTGKLVAEQQEVPVDGAITVEATRRTGTVSDE